MRFQNYLICRARMFVAVSSLEANADNALCTATLSISFGVCNMSAFQDIDVLNEIVQRMDAGDMCHVGYVLQIRLGGDVF